MSIPQNILYEGGGTVVIEPLDRHATATATIHTGSGSTLVDDKDCTVSAIDTTLAEAAAAGDTAIAVATGEGVQLAEGDTLWLRSPSEAVKVRSVSTDDIELWSPLLYAHASGTVAEGTAVTLTVTAAEAVTLFWSGWARFTLADASVIEADCSCSKHPVLRTASEQTLRRLVPKLADMVCEGIDVDGQLDSAHEAVLSQIEEKDRVFAMCSSTAFELATCHQYLATHFEPDPSESGTILYERYVARLKESVAALASNAPHDTNQNNIIEPHERVNMRGVRVSR